MARPAMDSIYRPAVRWALLTVLSTSVLACKTELSPTNPFDPETPPSDQAEAVLTGVVVSRSAGEEGVVQPVEGALVGFLEGPQTVTPEWLSTDSQGIFNFGMVMPGTYRLEISHPAYLGRVVDIERKPGQENEAQILMHPVPAGSSQAHITGEVHKSAELGLPPEIQDHSGVIIEIEDTGVRTISNSAGLFDLFVSPGTYNLIFNSSGYQEVRMDAVEAPANQVTRVSEDPIVLSTDPGVVSGVARVEGGADGQHGDILVSLAAGISALTDTDGNYRLTGVTPGTHQLTAFKSGFDSVRLEGVVVEGGRETNLSDILLLISRGEIQGQVLLGGPVADHSGSTVGLSGTPFAAVTNSEGLFTLSGVPVGSYELKASHEGYVPAVVGSVAVAADQITDVGTLNLVRVQGDFTIQGGAAYTRSRDVVVVLNNAAALRYRISEDPTFDGGILAFFDVPADMQVDFTLSAGDGPKQLFVEYEDAEGTVSGPFSAGIILDTTPPDDVAVSINDGAAYTNNQSGFVTLSFRAIDAACPPGGLNPCGRVTQMQVSNDTVFDEPWETYVAARTHTLDTPGTDGAKNVYVRYRDEAGNETPEAQAAIAAITLDTLVPSMITFEIEGGANYTSSPMVELHIVSADAAFMAISNSLDFSVELFETLCPTSICPDGTRRAWFLESGDGPKTVYVKLRDLAGNVSDPSLDGITLDTVGPGAPIVLIEGGAAYTNTSQVDLALSATDSSDMRLSVDGVFDGSHAQENWNSFSSSATVDLPGGSLPPQGEIRQVYAQFRDEAGNTSPVVWDDIVFDNVGPTGSPPVIDGGAGFTNSVSVTVALQAENVDQMRLSSDGVFDSEPWVAFASSAVVLLPAGDCAAGVLDCKEICAQFRDLAGNLDLDTGGNPESFCANITLDSEPPSVPLIITAEQVVDQDTFNFDIAGPVSDSFFSHYEIMVQPADQSFSAIGGNPTTFTVNLTQGVGAPETASTQNIIRIRAVDRAGNISPESSLLVVEDSVAPNPPGISAPASTDVNQDNFVLYLSGLGSSLDANFSHYEIRNVVDGTTPAWMPTSLQDGLVFALLQGDGSACSTVVPCDNQLQVRAVDRAANVSPMASLTIYEDSVAPLAPEIAPETATVRADEIRLQLMTPAVDTRFDTYELRGGQYPIFEATPETDGFLFQLDQDQENQLCLRGRDRAGNVSPADCAMITEQSTQRLTANSYVERYADIFGDLLVFGRNQEVILRDLSDGSESVLQVGSIGPNEPRIGSGDQSVLITWTSGTRLWVHERPHDPNQIPTTTQILTFIARGLTDTDGRWVVYNDAGEAYLYDNTNGTSSKISASTGTVMCNTSTVALADMGWPRIATRDEGGSKSTYVVWCDIRGASPGIYRYDVSGNSLQEIAANVDEAHPVITREHIFYMRAGEIIYQEYPGGAEVSTGITARRITDAWSPLLNYSDSGIATRLLYEVEVDGQIDIHMLTVYADASTRTKALATGLLAQMRGAIHGPRVVWEGSIQSDLTSGAADIYLHELGVSRWASIYPSKKAWPRVAGDRLAWSDNRSGSGGVVWYDIASGTESEVAEAIGFQFEGLGGPYVSWSEPVGANSNLWVKDLVTDSAYRVTGDMYTWGMTGMTALPPAGDRVSWMNTTGQLTWTTLPPGAETVLPVAHAIPVPDISGSVLVWTNVFGDKAIHCYDLDTGQGGQVTPGMQGGGRLGEVYGVPDEKDLIWTEGASGDTDVWWCRLKCTNAPTCVPVQITTSGVNETYVDVENGLVVWTNDKREPGAPSPSDVVVHNLLTRETMTITKDTDGFIGKRYPRVHDGRIVWEDERFGSTDIVYYELPR